MQLRYKHTVAIIYTVVLFLDRMDLTIVNITLPTLAKYFGVALTATSWINLAFLLALAISIPVSGWLGERFGFKKIYVGAMLLFGLASTLSAAAPTLSSLIVLRFIQGIGGGLLIPVGMTLLYRSYDKSEYASITSFTFLPALIAPAIAPLLGGILLDTLGWRFVFLFSGPICLVLAFTTWILLKEEEHHSRYPLDKLGFLLIAVLLMDLFFSLSSLNLWGLLLLIPLLILFIWAETKSPHPLINLRYFKHHTFVTANLLQLCFQICHFGAIFLIGLFLQVGVGFSATAAGAIMGMQALGAMAMSRYSARLFNRYGAKWPISVGLLGIAILSPCVMLINHPRLLGVGLMLFFVRGLFSGLCGTPIQTLSVIGFAKTEISTVSGIFNASRQVAISLGIALSALLLGSNFHFDLSFAAISLVALIGIGLAQRL